VDVKEDNSIQEHLMQVKASWAKKDAEAAAVAPPAKGKPPKGVPQADEALIRQQRSKESRERFLQNLRGVFLPYVKDGKPVLSFEDEPGLRRAPILDPSQYRIEEPIACPQELLSQQYEEGAPADPDSTQHLNPVAQGVSTPNPAGAPPTTSLAPHVAAYFKTMVAEAYDMANKVALDNKTRRCALAAKVLENANQYWVVHRPDKQPNVLESSFVEEDKGKGKPAPKGKK
jgi:hypothetical protein